MNNKVLRVIWKQLITLFNYLTSLGFIKLWNWLKKALFSKNNLTLKLWWLIAFLGSCCVKKYNINGWVCFCIVANNDFESQSQHTAHAMKPHVFCYVEYFLCCPHLIRSYQHSDHLGGLYITKLLNDTISCCAIVLPAKSPYYVRSDLVLREGFEMNLLTCTRCFQKRAWFQFIK